MYMYICRSMTTHYYRQEKYTQLYIARAGIKRLKDRHILQKRRYELSGYTGKLL